MMAVKEKSSSSPSSPSSSSPVAATTNSTTRYTSRGRCCIFSPLRPPAVFFVALVMATGFSLFRISEALSFPRVPSSTLTNVLVASGCKGVSSAAACSTREHGRLSSPLMMKPHAGWEVTSWSQWAAEGRGNRGRVWRGNAHGFGQGKGLLMAANGSVAGAVSQGGVGAVTFSSAFKTAALALYSVAVSVQPAVLILTTKAVMKLVASCALGYGFSKNGILDQSAITSLSKLIFFVFQPCLLFVNVASTLGTPGQKLSKLLVLPIFAIFQIMFGSLVGKSMEKLLRLSPGSPEARELRMCTSFANSGPLPLLFVDSIFGGHPDPTIMASAVAYISFYLLGWSPMFWTAGYTMVAGKPQPAPSVSEVNAENFRNLTPMSKFVARCHRIEANPTFKRVVSPPVMGCIAGMIVGLVPWGKKLLLGRSAPLSPIFDAIKGLGNAYLPAAILVLAGSLARPSPYPSKSSSALLPAYDTAEELVGSRDAKFYKKVGAIMASRFIVMPFVAAGMLMVGLKLRLIPYDKLVWFVLLMEGCMPSAQNSVVILQMEKKPDLAASMAKTLTAVYLLSAVPIAFLLSGILQFVQL